MRTTSDFPQSRPEPVGQSESGTQPATGSKSVNGNNVSPFLSAPPMPPGDEYSPANQGGNTLSRRLHLSRRGRQLKKQLAKNRRKIPAIIVLVFCLIVTTLALLHPGVPTSQIDVNDGGIWVTNSSRQLVGHLNYQTRRLDAALRTDAAQFDIGQAADTVTFSDESTNSIAPIDVAGVRMGATTSLTERAQAVQGGERIGVLDGAEGNLWVLPASEPSTVPMGDDSAIETGLTSGVVTTSVNGTVMAVSAATGQFVTVTRRGYVDQKHSVDIPDMRADALLQITAVGEQPVAFDQSTNTLFLPDGSARSLSDEGVPTDAILQNPGPDHDAVLLANPNSLISVPLNGDPVTITPANEQNRSGKPAAPTRHEGCSYGAWAGSGSYVRLCDDAANDTSMNVDTLKSARNISFRTNRKLIVLNEINEGGIWLPDMNMAFMDDWDEIDQEIDKEKEEEESPEYTDEIIDPQRKDKNTPPDAVDDEFGVRPGRATTLPVLQNDTDIDGDVLTARPISQPQIGAVTPTRGGQALQMTDVPDDASGSTTFVYEAYDGQASDSATVTISVHPWDQNAGPVQIRKNPQKLGAGAAIEYNVLPDWNDPDGDPIFLQSASAPDGIQVQYREEGTLNIRDLGAAPGQYEVNVVVSDGRAETQGVVPIVVQPPGNIPPVAHADFYVARAGEALEIEPLTNDTDPNGDGLTLVGVSEAPAGTQLTPDLALGSITFKAQAPGTYQFTYTISDGPSTVLGIIRIDVVEADSNAVPVADDDLVVLPAGGEALAAPLNNDSDPAGGVLVIQQVEPTDKLGLRVTLVDRHLLRITAPGGLDEAVSFQYSVSNGSHTAQARITVVPSRALDDKKPPVLQPDHAKVRVGDVASVPVLENDRSPAGLAMKVDPKLQFEENSQVGTPFVTGNLVRLEAGTTPGVMHVSYTVHDMVGNMATSTVVFEVVALEGANAAPQPRPLTAWAVSGQTTRIPVPLSTIDPDGDSVTLVGIEQAPSKGTIELGTDWIEYTPARKTTGTDVFTYIVEDRQGKQATARVRVGIAPPAGSNQPPTAVKDVLLVKPGRTIMVNVLANDIDPDGDSISLVPDSLSVLDDALEAEIVGTGIQVEVPEAAGTYVMSYQVTDSRGGVDNGTLTINAKNDAPLMPPIARDDVVALADMPDSEIVPINVVENDEDPDGTVADLVVSTRAPDAEVKGGIIEAKAYETRRLLVYTITDQDGLSSSAVVSIPGTDQTRPRLDQSHLPIKARAGSDVVIDIRDHVITRAGRTAMITDESRLKASWGLDPKIVLEDQHRLTLHTDPEFSGKTSVSFEVRDGVASDTSALSAVLSLPIVVQAAKNQPPAFIPTSARVAAGEEPITLDLSAMVDDPDDADPKGFKYALVKSPRVVSATLDGHMLSLQAGVDQATGTTDQVTISVDDGSGPVVGEIPVTVVTSTRPLIQVSDALIDAANAGGTETIDLTKYTINPFPETPIRIVSSQIEIGEGTVDPQGTVLHITPAVGFHGQMTVNYRLIDATNDPGRMVEGNVRLVVRDRPEPPSNVSVMATGPGSATVTFQPGADNGAAITSFTLTDVTTGQEFTCDVASCPLSGLANGLKHSFSVVAHNDVGASDSSPASEPVLVDVQPSQPAAPTLAAGDGSVTVTWNPPANEGSPITAYEVTLSDGQTQRVDGATTSVTFTNLTNGQPYYASVVALNSSPSPSQPSEPSAQVAPFGPPLKVSITDIRSTPSADDPNLAAVSVSWAVESDNGSPLTAAHVTLSGGGKGDVALNGELSGEITLQAQPQEGVVATVWVDNAAGSSRKVDSKRFTVFSTPVVIDLPTVTATGEAGTAKVTAETKKGNGYNRGELELQYSVNAGQWTPLQGKTITGLPDGQEARITFRQVAPGRADGPATEEVVVTAYGQPTIDSFTATSTPDGVDLSWAITHNAGAPITSITVKYNGKSEDIPVSETSRHIDVDTSKKVKFKLVVRAEKFDRDITKEATSLARGTITPVPSTCNAEMSDKFDDCHTFKVKAWGWDGNLLPLRCEFKSDADGQTYQFQINLNAVDYDSNAPTHVTDQETMKNWLQDGTLTCETSQ